MRGHAARALVAVALVATAEPALALDEAQKGVVDRLAAEHATVRQAATDLARHYALLLWVEDYCNGRSSQDLRAYIAEKGRIDADAFEAGWMETFEMLGRTDPKSMCGLALELYGPQGRRLRGAWDLRGPVD
jgi:hypothetical protein